MPQPAAASILVLVMKKSRLEIIIISSRDFFP
jgi:hypothetical protein